MSSNSSDVDEADFTLNSGRPVLANRQASFSKRHASFDTPCEIPFPADVSNVTTNNNHNGAVVVAITAPNAAVCNPALTRRSSASTVTPAVSRSQSPSTPQQQDQYRQLRQRLVDEHIHQNTPPNQLDEDALQLSGLFLRNSKVFDDGVGTTMDHRKGPASCQWDSEHLRPHLLAAPRPPSPRSRQQPANNRPYHFNLNQEAPTPSLSSPPSPYSNSFNAGYYTNQDNSDIYAPKAARPTAASSTSSLPLPTDSPFFALSSATALSSSSSPVEVSGPIYTPVLGLGAATATVALSNVGDIGGSGESGATSSLTTTVARSHLTRGPSSPTMTTATAATMTKDVLPTLIEQVQSHFAFLRTKDDEHSTTTGSSHIMGDSQEDQSPLSSPPQSISPQSPISSSTSHSSSTPQYANLPANSTTNPSNRDTHTHHSHHNHHHHTHNHNHASHHNHTQTQTRASLQRKTSSPSLRSISSSLFERENRWSNRSGYGSDSSSRNSTSSSSIPPPTPPQVYTPPPPPSQQTSPSASGSGLESATGSDPGEGSGSRSFVNAGAAGTSASAPAVPSPIIEKCSSYTDMNLASPSTDGIIGSSNGGVGNNSAGQRTSVSSTGSGSSGSSRAPYEPFLSHAPPRADTSLSVETLDDEYRLIARLPGYKRDCIMLSTRRRRVLHIAADSWEDGGGHFERRISFGYDADLYRVRAEFDGEHLRVIVPRKTAPVLWIDSQDASERP